MPKAMLLSSKAMPLMFCGFDRHRTEPTPATRAHPRDPRPSPRRMATPDSHHAGVLGIVVVWLERQSTLS